MRTRENVRLKYIVFDKHYLLHDIRSKQILTNNIIKICCCLDRTTYTYIYVCILNLVLKVKLFEVHSSSIDRHFMQRKSFCLQSLLPLQNMFTYTLISICWESKISRNIFSSRYDLGKFNLIFPKDYITTLTHKERLFYRLAIILLQTI